VEKRAGLTHRSKAWHTHLKNGMFLKHLRQSGDLGINKKHAAQHYVKSITKRVFVISHNYFSTKTKKSNKKET